MIPSAGFLPDELGTNQEYLDKPLPEPYIGWSQDLNKRGRPQLLSGPVWGGFKFDLKVTYRQWFAQIVQLRTHGIALIDRIE